MFNGDNYSQAWHDEAARRGLPNLKNTVDALPVLNEKEVKELFKKYEVLQEDELFSRYNVQLESYCKTVNIESLLTANIARTIILPAALEYQLKLAQTIATTKAAVSGLNLGEQENLLKHVCDKVSFLQVEIDKLEALILEGKKDDNGDHGEGDLLRKAKFYQERIIPAMDSVREGADKLETIVDDALWPLPKFREMLYIY
ncbi:MAG: glutamine synthetase [Cyanobacteriota bacterium erpe_2018_sw_21hr_WHONDRS-SW48-000092_B_bin.40]|nr:glutamine synthetase [Cyanobacteriota bacterium erpe_2018_sw_21hr_WHONDRS-SW48-000092_B_bin.40]